MFRLLEILQAFAETLAIARQLVRLAAMACKMCVGLGSSARVSAYTQVHKLRKRLQWKSFFLKWNFEEEKKDWNGKRDPFARNVWKRKGYAQKVRR